MWNREFYHFGVCGGGLRSGGLRGGGLRGGDLRGGSLRSDENLRSFRQAKILITARCATFLSPAWQLCGSSLNRPRKRSLYDARV